MKLTAEQVIARADAAKKDKQIFDSELQECYRYVMPSRNAYNSTQAGERGDDDLFDDTAPNALREFAGLMQSSLCRPYTKWASLVPGTNIPDTEKDEWRKKLAPVNEILINAIWQSNFDSQVLEMFYDLGIGTGSLLVTDGGSVDDPLKFQSVPFNEVYPELGAFGDIDTNFRCYTVIARNIMQRWPDGTLGDKLQQKVNDDPSAKIDIIEAVVFHPADKHNKAKYIYQVVAKEFKHEIYTYEMKESAWVTPRWDTRAGEAMGRGPAWNMLPTIKTVNMLKKLTLMNAEAQVNNMWLVNDSSNLNPDSIMFEPNEIITAEWEGNSVPIQSLGGNADFNVGQLLIKDMQQDIKEAFFTGSMGNMQDATKSATEISIRNQQRLQQLGAQFGRLQTEFINKLIRRVYSLLADRKLVPEDLLLDGKQVSIQVEGTLAKAQTQEEGQNMLNYLSVINGLAPNMVPMMMSPDSLVWLGETMGVPAAKMPTSSEIEEKMKAFADVQQAQQQPLPPAQ